MLRLNSMSYDERKNKEEIEELLDNLDGSGSDSEWSAVDELRRILDKDMPKYLLEKFRSARKWTVRSSCVYHAVRYAKESQEAINLGMEALKDKSKDVRYRACMLLAYSLRSDLLPELYRIASEIPAVSRDDLLAAIDAIENKNHHFFIDRDHSGMMTLNIA